MNHIHIVGTNKQRAMNERLANQKIVEEEAPEFVAVLAVLLFIGAVTLLLVGLFA